MRVFYTDYINVSLQNDVSLNYYFNHEKMRTCLTNLIRLRDLHDQKVYLNVKKAQKIFLRNEHFFFFISCPL